MISNIDVLTHSSIRIRSELGTIYVDPFHVEGEPHDAAFVLVTHDHYDHFSVEDIKKICTKETLLVAPRRMEATARSLDDSVARIVTVEPGESYTIDGLPLETVPAYNTLKPFHPKNAGWVGYILTLDGQRIYIAGDTDITKENKAVHCDIALVPAGGTYTMDAKKAAKLVNTIRPQIAVPTHYGDIVGKMEDADIFAAHVDSGIRVENRMLRK